MKVAENYKRGKTYLSEGSRMNFHSGLQHVYSTLKGHRSKTASEVRNRLSTGVDKNIKG